MFFSELHPCYGSQRIAIFFFFIYDMLTFMVNNASDTSATGIFSMLVSLHSAIQSPHSPSIDIRLR